MKKILCILLCLAVPVFAQKFEGLALTPPMGFNTWNTFATNINEVLLRQTADAMVKNGMRDAGYTYIVIDDCWSLRERDANGNLVPDPAKFPSGMKALGDYLHARGFKFGIYSCAGSKTCGSYPGSQGHEYQDALLFASWGIDYLKYDWCNTGTRDAREAYTTMRDALFAAKRPVVFSICEWGSSKPWEWAKDVGHLWRTTGDINACYNCVQRWERGWKLIVDLQYSLVQPADGQNNGIGQYAGPGHWNDPDMLEVGKDGLTFAESRSHFSMWCILAAPLIAGNDVRSVTPEILAIMTDKEALAIDQDAAGKEGWRFRAEPNLEIWVRELGNGDWALALINTGDKPADLTVDFSHMWFFGGKCQIHDIWDKKDVGTTEKPFTKHLDTHDVAFLRLKPIKEPAAK
jgi:alpha-galactosidase